MEYVVGKKKIRASYNIIVTVKNYHELYEKLTKDSVEHIAYCNDK